MKRILFYILWGSLCVLPVLATANSLEEYRFDASFFSGSYSPEWYAGAELHFNRGGNYFGGKIFFQDLKQIDTIELEIEDGGKVSCIKQLRGFYINTARGNRVWPLDQDSLGYLQSVDSGYNDIVMSGGLYICTSPANGVIGYIQHQRKGETYHLIAGLDLDFDYNTYIPFYTYDGNFLFVNSTTQGYLWDSYGGIAEIFGSGLDIERICGNNILEYPEVCDDGSTNGLVKGGCNSTCNGYVDNICGNGEVEHPEVCDDGSLNGQAGKCNLACNGYVTVSPPLGGGGGGGGGFVPIEPIQTGIHSSPTGDVVYSPIITGSIVLSPFSKELNNAYQRAYSKGITTMPTIQQANMTGTLIRKHAAKMISEFATKVVGKQANTTTSCQFSDVYQESEEMKYYMTISCQLGLMGLNADGTPNTVFNPDDEVTRAQFGTMLSRLLYGGMYNGQAGQRYTAHLNALNKATIMTKISQPNMLELRGRVMLMMMRVSNIEINNNNLSKLTSDTIKNNPDIVSFENNVLYTDVDFVPIKGKLSSDSVARISVTHTDSNGLGVYNNYFLQKFNPGDKKFIFYAYKKYNSLTINDINDINEYNFNFFDINNKLIFLI